MKLIKKHKNNKDKDKRCKQKVKQPSSLRALEIENAEKTHYPRGQKFLKSKSFSQYQIQKK